MVEGDMLDAGMGGRLPSWFIVSCTFFGFLISRWMLWTFLLEPLGVSATELKQRKGIKVVNQLLTSFGHAKPWPQVFLHRLEESAWKSMMYALLLTLGCAALYDQPWLYNSRKFWEGWPNQAMPEKVRLYYCAEGAFYLASIFTLYFWEERRKDFRVMMIHHFVTVTLIVMSASLGLQRVGSVVMLLHDPSDIFLETAKTSKYLGAEVMANVLFAGLILSWIATRLAILPFFVIRSTLFEMVEVLGKVVPWGAFFNLLLLALLVMHIYWFCLIVQVAVKAVLRGTTDDIREQDEPEVPVKKDC